MNVALAAAAAALALLLLVLWRRQVALRREAVIRSFVLPKGLFQRLQKQHPDLSLKDCQLVARGLRQFFLAHLKSGRRYVSMPSQIVDDLWHEFILYTKNYEAFCRKAFGRFLHHTPAVVLGNDALANTGLRRCWWVACQEENINPRAATRLPLLFAIDAKLDVPNGFHYAADCGSVRRRGDGAVVYCGADFATPAGEGAAGGGFEFSFDSGCGGGDGCGGGGCGGD